MAHKFRIWRSRPHLHSAQTDQWEHSGPTTWKNFLCTNWDREAESCGSGGPVRMSRVVISGASRRGTCAFTSHGGWLGVGGVAKGDPARGHVIHGPGPTNGLSRKWANGWSLLHDVTSCYIPWPIAARQQFSASGGRRQLMQGVFGASMGLNVCHFHHVALPQHTTQLARYCLHTTWMLAPKDCFATDDSNVFQSQNFVLWPFSIATDLHTSWPWLIVN